MGWFSTPIANGLANIIAFGGLFLFLLAKFTQWRRAYGPGFSRAWQKASLANLCSDLRILKRMKADPIFMWSRVVRSAGNAITLTAVAFAGIYFGYAILEYRIGEHVCPTLNFAACGNDLEALVLIKVILWYAPASFLIAFSPLVWTEGFQHLHQVAEFEKSREKILRRYLRLREKRDMSGPKSSSQ